MKKYAERSGNVSKKRYNGGMTTHKPKQTVAKLKESFNFVKATLNTHDIELKVLIYVNREYKELYMTTTRAGSICFMFNGDTISAVNLKKLIG